MQIYPSLVKLCCALFRWSPYLFIVQESAYQYIQANGRNNDTASNNGQTSNKSQPPVQEGESSRSASVESQLAMDEALARTLQELGEDFEDFYISEPSGTAAGKRPIAVYTYSNAKNLFV